MSLTVLEPPAALPVTVAEAKAYARINYDDDDAVIETLIQAARDHLEQATGRTFVATTYKLTLDEFAHNEIQLPRSPILSIESVTYDDRDGNSQTLATSGYTLDLASEPGWIVPDLHTRWPATFQGVNALQIVFRAGYASDGNTPPDHAANVPARAKLAVKSLVAHWYAEREPIPDTGRITEIPYHLTRLVNGLRVWR